MFITAVFLQNTIYRGKELTSYLYLTTASSNQACLCSWKHTVSFN